MVAASISYVVQFNDDNCTEILLVPIYLAQR